MSDAAAANFPNYSNTAMKAHEMFTQMTSALSHSIVGWLRDSERNVYRTALDTLANQRKLRPIFINRKNRVDQAQWLIDQLKLKSNEAVGANLANEGPQPYAGYLP